MDDGRRKKKMEKLKRGNIRTLNHIKFREDVGLPSDLLWPSLQWHHTGPFTRKKRKSNSSFNNLFQEAL